MISIKLRDYQTECVEKILLEADAGTFRQLVALPTGSGKTVVMGELARRMGCRTLVIAHREELISQAVGKFQLVWPEVSIGVCMADRNEIHAQVVIASVQSASRPKRLEQLAQGGGFDLLLIDEAHHATAESYQAVINGLGFNDASGKLLVGVTATPGRSDGQGLGETFQKVTFARSIGTMIKSGYLAPVVGRKILTKTSLEGVHSRMGDFAPGELAEAVNNPERNNFIVAKFLEHAGERKGVAFCVDVQHCKDIALAFTNAGIASEAVWGDMDTDSRKDALERLKTGEIQVCISCGILTEGFDEPSIDCIIMARPTKSQSLYIQCVGRGLRLWPGKQNCLVLDFTDQGHNLESSASLSSTIPEAKHIKERPEGTGEGRESKISVLRDFEGEFDILGGARLVWMDIGQREWSLIDDDGAEIVIRPQDGGYIAFLYIADADPRQIVTSPMPLEYCSGICEDFARNNLKTSFADTSSSWMQTAAPATQAQREFLERTGAFKPGMTKVSASLQIRKIRAEKNKSRRSMGEEPATTKQQFFLRGVGIDPKGMTKLQAMLAIAKIKQRAI